VPLAGVHYEAMAAGLPIIITKRGGNHEVLQNEEEGIVIKEYKEPKEFVKAATKLIENPKLGEKTGRIGRNKAEEIYNFNRVASDLEMKGYIQHYVSRSERIKDSLNKITQN
jgi:spore coat protein SA